MKHLLIDPRLFADLRRCSRSRDLDKGKDLHAAATERGDDSDIRVANTLISMYGKCRSMVHARQVFESMPKHDVVSWNTLILGYAENGQPEEALQAFLNMDCAPDVPTFLAVIKACTILAAKEQPQRDADGKLVKLKSREIGVEIHSRASGISDIRVMNTLVGMYAKCGCLADASRIFERMQCHDVISWNALIFGHVENGEGEIALDLYIRMRNEGFSPNSLTLVAALKACTCLAVKQEAKQVQLVKVVSLAKGMLVHTHAVVTGCFSEVCVSSTLVNMYAKCGSLMDARKVFDGMHFRDVVTWNAMMFGYADNGEGNMALELFSSMRHENCIPNWLTFVAALKACTNLASKGETASLEKGIAIHFESVHRSFVSNSRVSNILIGMYGKCGSMVDARKVFDGMLKNRDVVSWTSLILGYADNGEGELGLSMFMKMETSADPLTIVAALKACASMAVKEEGKQLDDGKVVKVESRERGKAIHEQAKFCIKNTCVATTLVDMYTKCGAMDEALVVFEGMKHRDVITWNAMMFGYVDNGEAEMALRLFARMQREGCRPSPPSFVAAFKACARLAAKEVGKLVDGKLMKVESRDKGTRLHSFAKVTNCSSEIRVANTLIDMYSKCGCMIEARKVFSEMREPDSVSWTSLILGYADNGEGQVGLELFLQMGETCPPDALTYVAALKACGVVGALEFGKALHLDIYARGLEKDAILPTCLVDFYGKCGCMVDAQRVFDHSVKKKTLITWNALLTGYSRQGDTQRVFEIFQKMQDERMKPDRVTFLCLLTSCSHAGLVDTGKEYFEAMASKYGLDPDIEHYHCMIDILGRANELDDAMALVDKMPFKPDAVTWKTILSSCRKWKNASLEKHAFDSLLRLDDKNPTAYVLMSQQ